MDDPGTRLAGHRSFDVLWVGDDRLLATISEKGQHALDLGPHAALRELTVAQVALDLAVRQGTDRTLTGSLPKSSDTCGTSVISRRSVAPTARASRDAV